MPSPDVPPRQADAARPADAAHQADAARRADAPRPVDGVRPVDEVHRADAPRRADAARNRQRLIDAARRLIDERGPAVALDEVARRAGVGNATLYRNFPTRGDLLVAVYAGDVDELCDHGATLLQDAPPGDGLRVWLDRFVDHVAARRPLALAATEGNDQRGELFGHWHARMTTVAAQLLTRAQAAGAVRGDLTAGDLLALANAAVIAGADPASARRLLDIMHGGFGADAAPRTGSPAD